MSIQALREQRAAKAKELRDLVNKADWNSDKDQPVYDAGMNEVENLDRRIANIAAANALEVANADRDGIQDAVDRSRRNNGDSGGLKLFENWLRNANREFDNSEFQSIANTMSTTTPAEGGYTVATDVATSVLDAMKAFGGMRDVSTVLRTAAGNPMSFPTSDGTAEEGEIVAENATAAALDLTFGTLSLPVYKYSSKSVAVPIELLQDSSVDIEGFVLARLVQRLGRVTNKHFTTGTGTGQPNGVVTAAALGRTGTTGQTLTVIYDDLIELEHSIDPAYRDMAGYMMHDTSVKVLRKVKDASQRPIFVPGYETGTPGGAPDTLLGRPITVNQHMPVMAANAKSILFGDFSKYTIRDCMDIAMRRFDDSAFALKGQVGFCGWLRSGGQLLDVGGAVKHYANSAT